VKQTKPYNTSVHISLNVGSDSKVKVELTEAVNVQLHISFNGMTDSEMEVEVGGCLNTSVHISFQVKVKYTCALYRRLRERCLLTLCSI